MDLLQYSQHLTKKEAPLFVSINVLIQRSISYFLCTLLHQYSNPQKSNRSFSRNRFPERWKALIKGSEVIKNWFAKDTH